MRKLSTFSSGVLGVEGVGLLVVAGAVVAAVGERVAAAVRVAHVRGQRRRHLATAAQLTTNCIELILFLRCILLMAG